MIPSASAQSGITILGRATEAEVVARFLRGELESPRWGKRLRDLLAGQGQPQSLVTRPDLSRPNENEGREALLDELRGWSRRQGLFLGFPEQIDWFRASLTPDQVLAIRYINWDWWLEISGGTRLPLDAAERIRAGEVPGSTAEEHRPIAMRLYTSAPLPELFAVAPVDLSKLVLVEGHVRLTAYALYPECLPDALEILLGVSDEISHWCQF